MANEQIDAFLKAAEPEPPPAPEPEPAAAAPEPPEKPTAPQPEPDAGPEVPEGEVIPRGAYEAERRRRQDWKERAARAEAERDALNRQLEEAKRAPAPAPSQQQAPLPPLDPQQDPQGFVQRVQSVMLNERLNNSEMFLREKLGPEKVDEYVTEFKQAAEADPALY